MEKNTAKNKGYSDEQKSKSWSQEKRKSDDAVGRDGDAASKKPKISFGFNKTPSSSATQPSVKPGVKLEAAKPPKQTEKTKAREITKPSSAFAKAFNDDDDDEEDEMPPEARMRMRNVGRETPTSCGPNSFGKTKQGFCDARSGGVPATKLPSAPKPAVKKW